MRRPWRRKEPHPSPGTTTGASAGTSSAAPPAVPGPAAPPPSPAGWAFLPPLQRALGDLGTTTAPDRFPDLLPTRLNPSFTGTMSHLISADAPPGVIDLDGPDAGPAPGLPGSAGGSVEMPLPSPPAPPGPGRSRSAQRRTSGAPAAQRSLTTVPDGGFGALQVPVVPEPEAPDAPPASDVLAERHGAGIVPEDGGTPEAEPSEVPARAAPVGPPELGPPPGTTPPRRPTAAEPFAPSSAVDPVPLQRRAADSPGRLSAGSPGSTFDGAATFVPLPGRPSLQRTADTASAGSTSTPAPLRPPSPASARRLGLGRPWPGAAGAAAVPAAAPWAAQRTTEPRRLPPAGPVGGAPATAPAPHAPSAPVAFPASPALDTVQRAAERDTQGAGTAEPAVPVQDAARGGGRPAGRHGPPPAGPGTMSASDPEPLALSTAPELPRTDSAEEPQELSTVPVLPPDGPSTGPGRPGTSILGVARAVPAFPPVQRTGAAHGARANTARPGAAPSSPVAPAIQQAQASVRPRPARPVGLHRPASPPVVSRSAAPATPDAGLDVPFPAGADRADRAPTGEVPVLPAAVRATTVPGGGAGWSPDPAGSGPAPIGALQRSAGDGPPPAEGARPAVGAGPAVGAVSAVVRLVAPAAEASGTGSSWERPTDSSARTATGSVSVQRDAEDLAPAAGTPAEPARSVAAPSAAADEGMSQEQVEELAKRLVGPIVRRLKADMLLDRERRGLRIDVG